MEKVVNQIFLIFMIVRILCIDIFFLVFFFLEVELWLLWGMVNYIRIFSVRQRKLYVCSILLIFFILVVDMVNYVMVMVEMVDLVILCLDFRKLNSFFWLLVLLIRWVVCIIDIRKRLFVRKDSMLMMIYCVVRFGVVDCYNVVMFIVRKVKEIISWVLFILLIIILVIEDEIIFINFS